jgi:hypothetical protein
MSTNWSYLVMIATITTIITIVVFVVNLAAM